MKKQSNLCYLFNKETQIFLKVICYIITICLKKVIWLRNLALTLIFIFFRFEFDIQF